MTSATFQPTIFLPEHSPTISALTLRGGGFDSDDGYEADIDPDYSSDTESDEDFYGYDDSQEVYEPYKTEHEGEESEAGLSKKERWRTKGNEDEGEEWRRSGGRIYTDGMR
ncbi:hypothetical protein BGZ60DRAFT_563917 [Tricladium varicosporioides]|nr:hypothetical protein BGZ60DRAFT_563917 [Hymenoscyphus varicosporioides]